MSKNRRLSFVLAILSATGIIALIILNQLYPSFFNSELSKTNDDNSEYLFFSIDNFNETGNDTIKFTDEITSSDWSNPEGKCFTFDTIQVWGPGFNIVSGDSLMNRNVNITISCDVLFTEETDAALIIEIHREHLRKSWFSGDINKFIDQTNKWQRAIFSQSIGYPLEKNDEIKAYVWSKKREPFSIDNLELKITEN